MTVFEKLKEARKNADMLESEASKLVRRVTDFVQRIKFPDDVSKNSFDSTDPAKQILGNHLIPQFFTSFDETADGKIIAGGMYSGSYSYYEYETISFPKSWLLLEDGQLEKAAIQEWQDILRKQEQTRERLRKEREEKDREKFEELRARFEG